MATLNERITTAAHKLFDEKGIQHVTIDAIAAEARTTKMGVYRHFESRDALIEDWMEATIERYRGALDQVELDHPNNPRAQLMAWAEYIAHGLQEISYRGCPFINTIAEIADRAHPVRQTIEKHKVRQAERIQEMCRKVGVANPKLAAAEITFLLEGAQVSAQNGSISEIEDYIVTIMRGILSR